MNYRRKILEMSPDESIQTLPYLCTAEYGGHIETVCLGKDGELLVFPPMPVVGPNAMYIAKVREPSNEELDELEARLHARSKTKIRNDVAEEFGDPNVALETNRERVHSLFYESNFVQQCDRASVPTKLWDSITVGPVEIGRVHDEVMLDLDDMFSQEELADYEEMLATPGGVLGSNGVFADIYGGCDYPCCNSSLVGKLVVAQPTLDCDENSGGEYIVLFQSDDSIYGVNTFNVLAGSTVDRLVIDPEVGAYEIIESYEDDGFIVDFISRLESLVSGEFDECEGCPDNLQKDATVTVIRQLERLLESKSSDDLPPGFNVFGANTGRFESAELFNRFG